MLIVKNLSKFVQENIDSIQFIRYTKNNRSNVTYSVETRADTSRKKPLSEATEMNKIAGKTRLDNLTNWVIKQQ
jgi:hypothetical protein